MTTGPDDVEPTIVTDEGTSTVPSPDDQGERDPRPATDTSTDS